MLFRTVFINKNITTNKHNRYSIFPIRARVFCHALDHVRSIPKNYTRTARIF